MKKLLLSALTLMSLVACGGGGGGGVASTTSTVGVSGVASKGLLGKATVNVYAVTNGAKGALLGSTITNDVGEYSVTGLTANSNPIIVEVVTTADTKFCDETKPLVGGKFDCTGSAGAGTVIRSTLPDLSKTSITHVTPFSEMAVAAAASTGSLTPATLAVGQATVQESLGFNPMTVKPVNAGESMDANQTKMMALLSAVMLDAKLNTCTGDASGMKCMIDRLNEGAKLTLTAGAYTAPSMAAAINAPKNNFTAWTNGATLTKADNSTVAASTITKPSNSFLTSAATQAATITAATPAAVDPVKATTAQGLENFITVMRDGVNSAKDTLDARLKAAELRSDKMIDKGTTEGLDVIDKVAGSCEISSSGSISCPATAGSGASLVNYLKVTGQEKYCFYYPTVDKGVTYTVSGTVGATNTSAGVASGALDATTTTNFTGNPCTSTNSNAKLSEVSLALSGTGMKKGSADAKASITSLRFKAYDQAAGSSKWVQIALSNLNVNVIKYDIAKNLTKSSMTGQLAITSSDGDNFTGSINSLNTNQVCTDARTPCNTRSSPTDFDVSLVGAVKEGGIFSTQMTASQTFVGYGETGYKPWLQNSASNPTNGTVTLKFTFVDNVGITLTETLTGWNSSNLGVNFTSNGNTLYLTAKGKNKTVGTNEQVLDGDITLTSSGVYNAKLRDGSDKKAVGEVFQGTEQIGNLVSGALYIRKADGSNGQIISLK
jgi:hypothetical protein